MLTHDVRLTGDGGGKVPALAHALSGRSRVARVIDEWAHMGVRLAGISLRPAHVNGGPGAMFHDSQERLLAVWAIEVADGEITHISSIVNREKLAHLGPVGDFAAVLKSAR